MANDRGEVTAPADVTPAIRQGTVFLTSHFADPLVNRVTSDALDPTAKIPEYKHAAVSVEPCRTDGDPPAGRPSGGRQVSSSSQSQTRSSRNSSTV